MSFHYFKSFLMELNEENKRCIKQQIQATTTKQMDSLQT